MGYWKGSGISIALDLIATVLTNGNSVQAIGTFGDEVGLTQVMIAIDPSKANTAEDGKPKPELNIIVAHNQTSMENPYTKAAIRFKEALEEVSGGRATATLHHGTLGENESELVEKTDDRFCIMGYWTSSVRDYYGKKPVVNPTDLKGMTIRTQSTPVVQEFWKSCGAIPTSVAWGELYQALSQGVVDSAENDYTSFRLKEHHKTDNGKYISETHHDYTTRLFLTTGQFYNALTEEQKGWFDEACRIATEENRQVTYEMFEESKQKVMDDGARVTGFKDVDIDAFKAIAIPIQDRFAAGGIFLSIFLCSVVIQMGCRYAGVAAIWTEDVSMYAFIWAAFMGAGAMVYEKRHFAFTSVSGMLKTTG